MDKTYSHHVALSFAGEDRAYVDQVAKCLKKKDVIVFYDLFEQVDLWGKNLYTHLADIYQNKAHYTVMFISQHYKEKLWTNHEREAAQARAFTESAEYILPARFDGTEIPAVFPTVGYISLTNISSDDFAQMVFDKLVKGGVFSGKSNLPPATPVINMTVDQYEERLANKITEAETKLQSAHDAEKTQLHQKIEELRKRAANPEAALAEAQETIAKLEDTLTREGNEISEARMTEAREALEAGDFSIADGIFAEIEAREQLAVERTARAAYARGGIAEQEIRWKDAANHFARAARLNPTYDHLHSARKLAWLDGQYDKAIVIGIDLLEIAKIEFGTAHENYAVALNEHALTLNEVGKYDLAEPLYLQAIEISKDTIGEAHPDYAIRLNNLATLYDDMGQYDLAEPLYMQAIKITKSTSGETHPEYATRLNNLAEIYRTTGKYDQAEPLYLQAIEIGKKTIGETHPHYAIRLNNLALFYYDTGQYDLAEPLYLQAIKIDKNTIGETHPGYAGDLNNLANLYQTTAQYNLAEPLYLSAIGICETSLGNDHSKTKLVKANYQNFLKNRP